MYSRNARADGGGGEAPEKHTLFESGSESCNPQSLSCSCHELGQLPEACMGTVQSIAARHLPSPRARLKKAPSMHWPHADLTCTAISGRC